MNPFERRAQENYRPRFNHIPIKKYDIVCETTEERRIYYSPKTNNKLISVTSMLGATNPNQDNALNDWRTRIGVEKAEKETNRCATRGNSVHLMAEQWLNNDLDLFFTKHTQRAITLFDRLRSCLNNINNIYAQEIALYSDLLGIAGRVDCIGEYKGIRSIIDFKTSTKVKKEKWITDYYLQCSAYSYMFEEMYNIKIPQIIVIIAVEESTEPQIFISNRIKYRQELKSRIIQYRRNENGKC